MSKNLRAPEMPEDGKGQPLYLRTIDACLARVQSSVATGAATNITLNAQTKFVSIMVENYPVFMRSATTATNANFDLYLLPGQHDLAVGNGVTIISYLANGGASTVTTIEKSSI